MRKIKKIVRTILSILTICFPGMIHAAALVYNADDSTTYANIWWGINNLANEHKWKIYNNWQNTNTGDDDISQSGGRTIPSYESASYYNHYVRGEFTDCAHFVSQCLIAGGLRDEMNAYLMRNDERYDCGGTLFTLDNPHDENRQWGANWSPPAPGIIHGKNAVTNAENDIWNTLVSTITYSKNKYNGETSMFSFLLNQYHAQYYYRDKPPDLAVGDVFIGERHTVLINRHPNNTSLVYTAHTRDKRDGNIDDMIADKGAELCHFFHMVRSVPYVKRVTLKQNGIFIYDAEWKDNGANRTLEIHNRNRANESADISIEIEFSQSIKSKLNTNLPQNQQTDGFTLNLIGPNNYSLPFQHANLDERGIILKAALSKKRIITDGLNGDFTFDIQATSYSDDCNQLDGNPATVAQYSEQSVAGGLTKFDRYEDADNKETQAGGHDKKHKFTIDLGAPFVKEVKIYQANGGQEDVRYLATYRKNITGVSTVGYEKTVVIDNPIYSGKAFMVVKFSEGIRTPVNNLAFTVANTNLNIPIANQSSSTTYFLNDTWKGTIDPQAIAQLIYTTGALPTSYTITLNSNWLNGSSSINDLDGILLENKVGIPVTWRGSSNWIVTLMLEKYHFSEAQTIFSLYNHATSSGLFKIEATFKGAGNASIGQVTYWKWLLDYDLATHQIVDRSEKTGTIRATTQTIDGVVRNVLMFDWDGANRQGIHLYDEDVFVEVKTTDEIGNVTIDNSKHFKITPDGIVYDPNDPNRSREQMLKQFGNTSNKFLFLASMFSMGGAEFSNTRNLLKKAGIDFRPFGLFGEDKAGGNLDVKLYRIKEQVDAFSANAADKITMVAWGETGLLAEKYLQKYMPTDKVAKLVTVGTPLHGVNSIPMAAQSGAISLLLQPAIGLLEQLKIDKIINTISEKAGKYAPEINFLSFLQKINRNDMVINPLNVIGLFLKRQEYAKLFQADSEMLRDLSQFSPEDHGIETASISTALWPDMGAAQLAMVGVFSGFGFAGLYQNVDLFSFASKTYNNLNDELADILANLVEAEISRLIINPITTYINDEIRKVDNQYLGAIWKQYLLDHKEEFKTHFDPKAKLKDFMNSKVKQPIQDKLGQFRNFVYAAIPGDMVGGAIIGMRR